MGFLFEKSQGDATFKLMFRAIGIVIILFALSRFFTNSFDAFDSATTETFRAAEVAAVYAQERIERVPLE